MDTLLSMRLFRQVAEQRSFVAAAHRLNLSAAMASKHVMHLEARLGTRLLHRTSRHVSLTEAGQAYFDHVRQMLDGLEEIEAAVGHASVVPTGLLRISAPVWAASAPFVAVLADFRERYKDVRLEIDLTGRHVNLVEEGYDLALRVSQSPGEQYVARALAQVMFCMVAAPAYLKKSGTPRQLADLAAHALLWYSAVPLNTGAFPDRRPGEPAVQLIPALKSGNESLLHLAALEGMGIAILPRWMIADDLASGRLVQLMGQRATYRATLLGLYPSRKYLSSKVRTFLDFLAADERLRTDAAAPRPGRSRR